VAKCPIKRDDKLKNFMEKNSQMMHNNMNNSIRKYKQHTEKTVQLPYEHTTWNHYPYKQNITKGDEILKN